MNIKQVLAGSLAAITAGATMLVAGISAAETLGDYVQASDGSLTSPFIVVGGTAAVGDVLSAVDIGVAAAGYATTMTEVSGATTVGVTNGVKVDTSSTSIYLGDSLTKTGVRTTITKGDLPSLLASGIFYDDNGISYNYDQYITWGAGTVQFGTSGNDFDDPALFLATGSNEDVPLMNYTIVFNKPLNISSDTVIGEEITLLGGKYTIGSGSSFTGTGDKLVLFGSSNAQLLSEGEEQTISVNSVEHTVKLLGVSSSTIAVVSVDGESKEVTQGNSYTISGVDVYVDSVFYYPKEAQTSQAKLSFGSLKLTLEDDQNVKTGTTEENILGTKVDLIGTANTGISKLTVSMTAEDSNVDYILAGGAFSDPVFNKIKVAFNGLNTGATEMLTVDNSGTTGAIVKFSDFRGNEKTFTYAYSDTATFNPRLNATASSKSYHVVENALVNLNDYILLTPTQGSEFSHIMQFSSAANLGSTNAYVELTDVFTGDKTKIYLLSPNYVSATFYLDGQTYHVHVPATAAKQIRIAWGTGSTNNTVGDATTLFPLIKTKRGGWLTFVDAVNLTTGVYELPTYNGTNITYFYNVSVAGQYNEHMGLGRVHYNITAGDITLSTGASTSVISDHPVVLFLEEKGKDASDTEVKDAILVTITDGRGTGSSTVLTIGDPTLTAGTTYEGHIETADSSVNHDYDRYGTHTKYDSDGQGILEITYPDEQAEAIVAVGSDPVFSTTAGGATVETAVKITSPVSYLDSEVSLDTVGTDLILVGGPCVNVLVEELMGEEDDCAAWAFTEGIIKEYTFGETHKALVVAGTTMADTKTLAGKVMTGTLSYEA